MYTENIVNCNIKLCFEYLQEILNKIYWNICLYSLCSPPLSVAVL